MKKLLLLLSLLISFVYSFEIKGNYTKAKDAFQVSHKTVDNQVVFDIKLPKDIYLYSSSIKVSKDNKEISLQLPKSTSYHEFEVYFNSLNIKVPAQNGKYTLSYQGCSTSGICYPPKKYNIDITNITKHQISKTSLSNVLSSFSGTNDQKILDNLKGFFDEFGYIYSLLLFLLIGILLSLTPCIFPIVPILSSILVSNSKNMSAKKGFSLSLIYVFGMSSAYSIVGLIAGIWGFSIQGSFQNPWVLSIFSIIFVLLSLSLFGLYDIKLPSSIQSKLTQKSDAAGNKGGFIGTFIMGFLSALIVGACTGPIIAGAFLLVSFLNDPIFGVISFFMMGFGVGIPLLILGLGFGKFMPKPGAWMSAISKIFGLILLGIAIVMISRILPVYVVMVLWGILAYIASYIFYSLGHIITKLIAGALMVYGLVIFYGAYIGAVSPLHPLTKLEQHTQGWTPLHSLKELDTITTNKPILIDFTATWCTYCKALERNTFSDTQIKKLMQNFTLLQVDITSMDDDLSAITNKFEVSGPPAIIFLDTQKNEFSNDRISGYIDSDEFGKILEVILNKN